MSFPMEWPFGDCQWGQAASTGFDASISIAEYCKYLLQREELEYSTREELSRGEIYVAPDVCRFRHPQILFLIASVWRFAEALTAVNAWVRKPKMYKLLSVLMKLSPEVFRDAMLDVAQNGDGQGSSDKKDKPAALKTALRALLLATSDVIGSDGHRRLLRHEGVSYSLCFGQPLTFLTPNLADKLMPMLLLANGQCIDLNVSEPTMPSRASMQKLLAADPVAQARSFEIMMVLFFIFVLGVRPECVSNQRGEPWKGAREWASDGCAASSFYLGILGAVLAFRAPIEAQGRGSLHPHVLVWLVSWCLQRVFEALLRDKDAFLERIKIWQAECIAAILSVTQASVEHLPARFGFHGEDHWGPGSFRSVDKTAAGGIYDRVKGWREVCAELCFADAFSKGRARVIASLSN